MKQVLRKGFRQMLVDEVPDPVVRPHHVIVRPRFSLISSGTETASIHQESVVKEVAAKPSHLRTIWAAMQVAGPVRTFHEVKAKFSEYGVLGYSGAGEVAAVHPTVTDLSIGDRVAYGGEGTGHGELIQTGRHLIARVPKSVSLEDACFTTVGSIALNAVRHAAVGTGDLVVVIGLGLVGQLIGQVVRCQGGRVIAVDLRSDRVDLAMRLGAERGASGHEPVQEIVNACSDGRGADCVIIAAAAKSAEPCRLALEIVRDRGSLVVVGAVDLSFSWQEMYLKEVQLRMARAYGPGSYDPQYEQHGQDYPAAYVRWTENRNMEEFLRLVAEGRATPAELVSHEFPLEDAVSAYDTVLKADADTLAVVLRYPDAPYGAAAPEFRTKVYVHPVTRDSRRSTIGVALVGAGNLARWAHLPNLKKMRSVTLEAICSASGARGKSYAKRFGARYCTTNYEDVLNDGRVDAVVIVSRNERHASQTVAALEAGKHVFVEKPMALTVEECRSLLRAISDNGRHVMVGFNRRFAPLYLAQKQVLVRRGGPVVIQCRVNSPGISGSYWMADPQIGGAILGEACHFIDLMHWLLEEEYEWVSACSLPLGAGEPIGQNNLTASFSFEDGSIASLTYSTAGSKRGGGELVEVYAAGITATCEDFKHLRIDGAGKRRVSRWFPQKGYDAQFKDFFASIDEGREPSVTGVDGARATLVCLKMLEAARERRPCDVELADVLA